MRNARVMRKGTRIVSNTSVAVVQSTGLCQRECGRVEQCVETGPAGIGGLAKRPLRRAGVVRIPATRPVDTRRRATWARVEATQ
jgi:hypothetical protein